MTTVSYVVEKLQIKRDEEIVKDRILPAHAAIVALGRHSARDLIEATKNEVPELYEVGDLLGVRDIHHSMHTAAEIVRSI